MITNDFFVLDVNYLRKPELNQLLNGSNDISFVLTENVIVETMKSENWHFIYKKNFAIICQHPEKIYVSSPIGNILEYERQNKKACLDIFNESSTEQIRFILNEMKNRNVEFLDNILRENISIAQQHVRLKLLRFYGIIWIRVARTFKKKTTFI